MAPCAVSAMGNRYWVKGCAFHSGSNERPCVVHTGGATLEAREQGAKAPWPHGPFIVRKHHQPWASTALSMRSTSLITEANRSGERVMAELARFNECARNASPLRSTKCSSAKAK